MGSQVRTDRIIAHVVLPLRGHCEECQGGIRKGEIVDLYSRSGITGAFHPECLDEALLRRSYMREAFNGLLDEELLDAVS